MKWDDRNFALLAVMSFFCQHKILMKGLLKSKNSRIYELYCVQRLVEWVKERYDVEVIPENNKYTKFKGSAGNIDRNRHLYLSVFDKNNRKLLEIHTNINVLTFGANNSHQTSNRSFASEIDIVVIDPKQKNSSMLKSSNLLIGLECKLRIDRNLEKKVINEVIGVRNEISFRITNKVVSRIDFLLRHCRKKRTKNYVCACPSSEYWLVQIGNNTKKFEERLSQSDVRLKVWKPRPAEDVNLASIKREFSGQRKSIELLSHLNNILDVLRL